LGTEPAAHRHCATMEMLLSFLHKEITKSDTREMSITFKLMHFMHSKRATKQESKKNFSPKIKRDLVMA